MQTKAIAIAKGTNGWTQKSLTFSATQAYNMVVIKLIYSSAAGRYGLMG